MKQERANHILKRREKKVPIYGKEEMNLLWRRV